MKIYNNLADIVEPITDSIVTVGNFDGVHLGHQELFAEVVSRAGRQAGASVVITFEPHPMQVVRPEIGIKLISTYEQKVEMISLAGIDILVVIPFTEDFATTSAETFVDEILIKTIGVKELVVGYDYAFGKGRQGNIDFLREQGRMKGFPVTVVEPYYVDEMLVSSSKIRELVSAGRMMDVKKLLGRSYQLRGTVQEGRKRGGPVVGFKTANLHLAEEDLCPKHGVYVTQVLYEGKCYGGALNIGYNPTFGENRLSVETHIFEFNEDIYGQQIKINLLKYLRGEKKFAGPEELAIQIREDISQAKEHLLSGEEKIK